VVTSLLAVALLVALAPVMSRVVSVAEVPATLLSRAIVSVVLAVSDVSRCAVAELSVAYVEPVALVWLWLSVGCELLVEPYCEPLVVPVDPYVEPVLLWLWSPACGEVSVPAIVEPAPGYRDVVLVSLLDSYVPVLPAAEPLAAAEPPKVVLPVPAVPAVPAVP
jgi:hypothetical protein